MFSIDWRLYIYHVYTPIVFPLAWPLLSHEYSHSYFHCWLYIRIYISIYPILIIYIHQKVPLMTVDSISTASCGIKFNYTYPINSPLIPWILPLCFFSNISLTLPWRPINISLTFRVCLPVIFHEYIVNIAHTDIPTISWWYISIHTP